MAYNEFPDEVSLKFRAHVLYVYAQSLLNFATELANDGAENLTEEDRNAFDDLVEQLERIWFESAKLKTRLHG